MLFTDIKSVSSMYSLYTLYVYISSMSVAHTELCIIYMPFTDFNSALGTYVLDFLGMPLLKFLRHTNYLYSLSS